MVKRPWLEVKSLLDNPEFLQHCIDTDVDAAEVLGVATYSRADKCSHPIHLLRIHPETASVEKVKVACDSNNSFMCRECSEFKKRLRVAQMLAVLERPGNKVLFLTVTAPSFGKVHRSQFSRAEIYALRHLDESEQYRRRLTVMKSRQACPCGSRHTAEEEIIGTPIGRYDYAAEVLWSANVPALMASAKESLKYWAKVAGIDPENFKIFAVYERQKRASLHSHFLIVVQDDAVGFETFVNNLPECDHATPFPVSARVPKKVSNGLSVGWDRYARVMKDKRAFADVMPSVTRFGSEFDARVLEADDSEEEVEVDAASLALVDELSVAAEIKNPKSYKRAAAYLAKYLSKNASSPFSPDALKEMPAPVRAHWAKFRYASVLLFTDKILHEAIAKGLKETFEEVAARSELAVWPGAGNLWLMGEYYRTEAEYLSFVAGGVRPSVMGDFMVAKLMKHALTVTGVDDIVQSYLSSLRGSVAGPANLVPRRLVKMRLNRLANNAGFTGAMTSTHNWGFSLKDMKENRKVMFLATNPDAEVVDYIWELDQVDGSVAAVAIPERSAVVLSSRESVEDKPVFAAVNVAWRVGEEWWEKILLDPAVFSAEDGIPYEWRLVSDY